MRRNADRFPSDFCFQPEKKEVAALRSQIATSNPDRGGRRHASWAFTERGALMAANVLNSSRAVQMSIYNSSPQDRTDEPTDDQLRRIKKMNPPAGQRRSESGKTTGDG
jgi:hypothetical protein